MNQVRLVPNADEPVWQVGNLFKITLLTDSQIYMLARVGHNLFSFVCLNGGGYFNKTVEIPIDEQGDLEKHMKPQLRGFEYKHLGPCCIEISPEKKS